MRPIIVVMGVSGSGKSTVGKLLAAKLKLPFFDADDFHSKSNLQKMKSGIPLQDVDRKPWLEELADLLSQYAKKGIVLACSSLKEKYRDILCSNANPRFIYLHLTKEQARARVARRSDHFMPSDLIDSQFESLEIPKTAITVDATAASEKIISKVLNMLS